MAGLRNQKVKNRAEAQGENKKDSDTTALFIRGHQLMLAASLALWGSYFREGCEARSVIVNSVENLTRFLIVASLDWKRRAVPHRGVWSLALHAACWR